MKSSMRRLRHTLVFAMGIVVGMYSVTLSPTLRTRLARGRHVHGRHFVWGSDSRRTPVPDKFNDGSTGSLQTKGWCMNLYMLLLIKRKKNSRVL